MLFWCSDSGTIEICVERDASLEPPYTTEYIVKVSVGCSNSLVRGVFFVPLRCLEEVVRPVISFYSGFDEKSGVDKEILRIRDKVLGDLAASHSPKPPVITVAAGPIIGAPDEKPSPDLTNAEKMVDWPYTIERTTIEWP